MAARITVLVYGVFCYLLFLGVFLYLAGFLANFLVPKGIDTGSAGPFGSALAINVALLVLFGIQHTVMARPGFKKWWTSFVPEPIERSTYLLVTFLVMAPLF